MSTAMFVLCFHFNFVSKKFREFKISACGQRVKRPINNIFESPFAFVLCPNQPIGVRDLDNYIYPKQNSFASRKTR